MFAVITSGPASAPIDEVRRITNFATGEIGALLAEALAARGFDTLLFRGRGATHRDVPAGTQLHEFTTNSELAVRLEELSAARGPDAVAVFQAAALSDYTVAAARGPGGPLAAEGKLPGNLPRIDLVLEPAIKLLPRLRGWFPHAWIAGWKYEAQGPTAAALAKARAQIAGGDTDATILNGDAYGPGFGFLDGRQAPAHFADKRELAQFLASRVAAFTEADK